MSSAPVRLIAYSVLMTLLIGTGPQRIMLLADRYYD